MLSMFDGSLPRDDERDFCFDVYDSRFCPDALSHSRVVMMAVETLLCVVLRLQKMVEEDGNMFSLY